MWTYRVFLSIFNLDSILRNVHPGTTLAAKIYNVETFETIIFQLCMFGSKSYSFNLQREPIQFDIS